jgi:hypothetical protein
LLVTLSLNGQLSDLNEVDGEIIQSKMQVFWCEKVGAWKLDNSYSQDKSSGDLLSDELDGFAYEVTGDVYSGALAKEALQVTLGYVPL